MKARLMLLVPAVALFAATPLLAQHRAPSQPHAMPRANQGHLPPPPAARPAPGTRPDIEHFSGGRVNSTPHVNHNTWYGHEPANDPRFHIDHPFAHGHFDRIGPGNRFNVLRIDRNAHRFWFPGGYGFAIADWDWAIAADWCWDCGDDFVVYEDPDHPGWYLLYNVETGAYVHVQYLGM
ncbi:hypothetical protein [Paracidobacterium acidisoli]|uniref:Uncharacterized protein n=1 Tax=Paracidobacterium acidisoli TaxID=2303751 RepID=A0A372IS84_9BACT|nr:hypothetical protein [Paracidobacterium acidisoli]MBT9330757.1 hypothetical protein [Paracidobacterium acidisoli]